MIPSSNAGRARPRSRHLLTHGALMSIVRATQWIINVSTCKARRNYSVDIHLDSYVAAPSLASLGLQYW